MIKCFDFDLKEYLKLYLCMNQSVLVRTWLHSWVRLDLIMLKNWWLKFDSAIYG